MATHTYRYQRVGVSVADLWTYAGATATVSTLSPAAYQDLTYDDSFHTGVLEFAASEGWDYSETDPPASAARTVAQVLTATLGADTASIPVASGWTDVPGLTVTLSSKGSTTILMMSSLVAGVVLGAQTRTLINGGSFSNAAIGPTSIDFPVVGNRSTASYSVPLAIPSTGSYTSYVIRIQAQGNGILSSLTPRLGSSLCVVEYD